MRRALACAAFLACSGQPPAPSTSQNNPMWEDNGGGNLPFTKDTPNVYVAKVKNVLVGLPPNDDDIAQVTADPNALGTLVDAWMKLPQYQTKMQRFFELAFQQTQITAVDFGDQLDPGQLQLDPNRATAALTLQTVQESFARTAWNIAASNAPFNTTMSTQTFALSTALKVFYGLMDAWDLDDKGGIHDHFQEQNPGLMIYATAKGPIPLSQTLDPKSANYMHWYDPGVANAPAGACHIDPIVYPARANTLYDILHGQYIGYDAGNTKCQGFSGTPQITQAQFDDWKMTTIRKPMNGEPTTPFYDLINLPNAPELVLNLPRVGFFSTPAFFANWQTNNSNEMRVTINQSFIVATSAQVDGSDPTVPSINPPPGLDSMHASNQACVACHQQLDPSRSILAATYSWNYHTQNDPKYSQQPGLFVFQGREAHVSSVLDFGNVLANHPLLAQGWAQKLCAYVNSEACATNDPEFQRIATLFQSSNFSWNGLVKAMVTSPITTHSEKTTTATTNGEIVAVARRDHLCAAWNARLGFSDACGLDARTKNPNPTIAQIVTGLPSDGYGRGSVMPVLPNQPTLFYRAATENLCEQIALEVIDNKTPPPNVKTWSSAQPDVAIADFVHLVIGLAPSDSRAMPVQNALTAHFTQAKTQQNVTPTIALQSTFVAACGAPTALSLGM